MSKSKEDTTKRERKHTKKKLPKILFVCVFVVEKEERKKKPTNKNIQTQNVRTYNLPNLLLHQAISQSKNIPPPLTLITFIDNPNLHIQVEE